MKCENCGKNEANVKYTQIINGEKREVMLCEECSRELGIGHMNFNMPIDFSSFFGDLLEGYEDNSFMPTLGAGSKKLQCSKCGLTWDDFLHTGNFGCSNCYEEFESRIDPILRSLQGATSHIGRLGDVIEGNDIKQNLDDTERADVAQENKIVNKVDELKEELKQAIKEERYEDAAKIRDEIKKLQ